LLERFRRGVADRGAAAFCFGVAGLAHRREQFAGAGLCIGNDGGVGVNRRISEGSMSIRIDFNPSGRNDQRDMVGNSSRVPIPIIKSVCARACRLPPSSIPIHARC